MSKFLITGKNGLLGKLILEDSFFSDNTSYSKLLLDISNIILLLRIILRDRPKYFINCAAYTNVEDALNLILECSKTNVTGSFNVAFLCNKYHIKLIHFSTNYVFEEGTHKLDSKYGNMNSYGISKRIGLLEIKRNCTDYVIIRVSWLFGSHGNNFLSKVKNMLLCKKELSIVKDLKSKITYSVDLVKATINLIKNKKRGIYHFANKGIISKYLFVKYMKDVMTSNTILHKAKSNLFNSLVKRPRKSILNTKKYLKLIGKIPSWKDAILRYLDES